MLIYKPDALTAAFRKSQQTDMQVAANSRSALNTARKVLKGGTNVHLDTLVTIGDYLGLDVEVRYVPQKNGNGAVQTA